MEFKLDYLIVIQARLGSTRFPNKVMQTVGGIPMVRRVWLAAKEVEKYCDKSIKVIVVWPERYPDIDENNVLERFIRLSNEFPSKWIIRLTADCPLISYKDILEAEIEFAKHPIYYSNKKDGYDVQIFAPFLLKYVGHKEHVLDFSPNTNGDSVNTKEDLERIRLLCKEK